MRFFLVLFLSLFIFRDALAFENAIFVVSDVNVQGSAESAHEAKMLAMNKSLKQAFSVILHRIKPDLPPNIDVELNFIRESVVSFSIKKEKIIKNSYFATIDYVFDPKKIDFFLKNLPETINVHSVLIIPVYRNNNNTAEIWENEWFYVWNDREDFITPIGDLDEVLSWKIDSLHDMDFLNQIANKYKIDDIIILECSIIDNSVIDVTIIRPYFLQRKKIVYENPNGYNKTKLLNKVADHLVENIKNTKFYSPNVKIDVKNKKNHHYALITSPQWNWKYIRNKVINNFKYVIKYVSPNHIIVEVITDKSLQEFKNILSSKRIKVVESDNGLILSR